MINVQDAKYGFGFETDAKAIQAALDDALDPMAADDNPSHSCEVYFPSGVYKIDETLTAYYKPGPRPGRLVLRGAPGAILDASSSTLGDAILKVGGQPPSYGTQAGSSSGGAPLLETVEKGQRFLTFDASQLARRFDNNEPLLTKGDVLLVITNECEDSPIGGHRVGDQVINVRNAPYNAKGDGTSSDADAIQSALCDALKAIAESPDGSCEVYFPKGVYPIVVETTLGQSVPGALKALYPPTTLDCPDFPNFPDGPPSPGRLILRGEPGAILLDPIDGSQVKEGTYFDALLSVGGWAPSWANDGTPLCGTALKGERSLTLTLDPTNFNVAKGDVLLISTILYCQNHPDDPSQRFTPVIESFFNTNKAELVEVAEDPASNVGIQTVVLKSALFDSYDVTGIQGDVATKVYKLLMPSVSVQNLEIRRNSNNSGLGIGYARDVLLDRCRCSGARYVAFALDHVYGGMCSNNTATDFFDNSDPSRHELSYGLAIDSSQYITTFGNRLMGGICALQHGGADPVRCVIHIRNVLDNDHRHDAPCLDFHGGTDYGVVIGNTILNGITSSCRNLTVSHNLIKARGFLDASGKPAGAVNAVILDVVSDSEYVRVTDNQIVAPTGVGIFVYVQSAGFHIKSFDVSRNVIRTAGNGINVGTQPLHPEDETTMVISELALLANDVVSTGSYALWFHGDQYQSGTATVNHTVQIDRLAVTGGRYAGGYGLVAEQLTNCGTMVLRGVQMRSPADSCLRASGFRDALVDGCDFTCDPGANGIPIGNPNRLAVSGDLKWLNTTVRNFKASNGIELTGATITVANNTHVNCNENAIGLTGYVVRPVVITNSLRTLTSAKAELLKYEILQGVTVELWATIVARATDGTSAVFRRRWTVKQLGGPGVSPKVVGGPDVIGVDKSDFSDPGPDVVLEIGTPYWNFVSIGAVPPTTFALSIDWFGLVELTMLPT